MLFPKSKLQEIAVAIDLVIGKIAEFEDYYEHEINSVHPNYVKSAKNLIHYLALRSIDVDILQEKLEEIGLPNPPGHEKNILHNLLIFKTIVSSLLNNTLPDDNANELTLKEADKILKRNTKAVFGKIKNKRKTAIMVTQPTEAATDKEFTRSLLHVGMDCARINCAHDDELVWKQIIDNIKEVGIKCKIMMDLGGPKIRTG